MLKIYSTVNCQLSTVNCQLSTVNYPKSKVNKNILILTYIHFFFRKKLLAASDQQNFPFISDISTCHTGSLSIVSIA